MNYFAYGSNMSTVRLAQRVPSARKQSVVRLPGYVLKFHKRSRDGSGKCNAFHTGKVGDEMYGVVFEVQEAEKPRLDAAKGLGEGYAEAPIELLGPAGTIKAFIYVAEHGAIDDSLKPYTWYKEFVVRGAQQHELPPGYIDQIEAVDAVADPDKERERKNRALPAGAE